MSTKRRSTTNDGPAFKRNFAHMDGNWASHIYFPVSLNSDLLYFSDYIVNSCNDSSVVQESSPHISLSKVFVLKAFQIDLFIRSLNKSIDNIYDMYL